MNYSFLVYLEFVFELVYMLEQTSFPWEDILALNVIKNAT